MKRWLACLLALVAALMPSLPGWAQPEENAHAAREIVQLLLQGETESVYARFAEPMRQAISLEQLSLLPEQIHAMAGEFVAFGPSRHIGETVSLVLQMRRKNLVAQVSFDGAGRVQGLAVLPQQKPQTAALGQNEEMVFVGPHRLPGVLTLPQGEGPFPAAVLVHGSGPNDRDETNGDTAIFRDLARALSRRGIAVLRYDKRTYRIAQGQLAVSRVEMENMTVHEETVEDAVAAVALLKEDSRIDARRVFIVGHSLGAMLAADIEQAGAGARGLVLMAGTLRPLCEVLADQMEAQGGKMREEIALARALPSMDEAQARQVTLLGVNGYYYWEEAHRDRETAFARAGLPMLVLQGALDSQVYADKDFARWQAFADEHAELDIALRLYDGLGHSFVHGATLDARVCNDMAAWMLSH